MTTKLAYNNGHWVLTLLTQAPSNVDDARRLLDKIEEEIRSDERRKVANFIEALGSKFTREFDAYRDYLEDKSKDNPEQISLTFSS